MAWLGLADESEWLSMDLLDASSDMGCIELLELGQAGKTLRSTSILCAVCPTLISYLCEDPTYTINRNVEDNLQNPYFVDMVQHTDVCNGRLRRSTIRRRQMLARDVRPSKQRRVGGKCIQNARCVRNGLPSCETC